MALLKSSNHNSVLGLTLEGRQIEAVLLGRANGGGKVLKTMRATLSLDPLTNDPELVGREIRNHLGAAGIRERHCVVGLPLQWALTLQIKVPAMPEADIPSFLQIEAERGFPYSPDDLSISSSRYATPRNEGHALMVAIPKSHLIRLDKSLAAAHLKPLSFSFGISALPNPQPPPKQGFLILALGENVIDLQVTTNGGVAALRSLEGMMEMDGQKVRIDAGMVAREMRITLGQLPKELRENISRLEVFGGDEGPLPLVKELLPLAREMGLLASPGQMESLSGPDAKTLSQDRAMAAYSLALRWLAKTPSPFEFLLPKQSPWAQAASRFASAKVLYAGAAASLIGLGVAGAFLWQQLRLNSLESQWREIQPRAETLDNLQQQSRKFRPWYDESLPSLRILRKLAEAFPEEGSVSAKTLEIKNLSEVTCAGQARDNQAFLRLLDRFRKAPEIADLKIQQVQGKAPLQFNLSFRWAERANP